MYYTFKNNINLFNILIWIKLFSYICVKNIENQLLVRTDRLFDKIDFKDMTIK